MAITRRSMFVAFFLMLHGFLLGHATSELATTHKIIGLMQVRNESAVIEQCLRALACYTDAIVILDDASEDQTVDIVNALAQELHIETIIRNTDSAWRTSSERRNRQALLNAGRALGGTHFIIIDADEMFASTCTERNWLRSRILRLRQGQVLQLPMLNLWGSTDVYRNDIHCNPYHKQWKAVTVALCDDGTCSYDDNPSSSPSGAVHISRAPTNRTVRYGSNTACARDIRHCIVHFKCVDLEGLYIKQAWYMCLEHIRSSGLIADQINDFYYSHVFKGLRQKNNDIRLTKVPNYIFSGYPFFDASCYTKENSSRKADILTWFDVYGTTFFEPLNIWNIPWLQKLNLEKQYARAYQDIVIDNKTIFSGLHACDERYQAIKTVLDKYKRPITVLDLGAGEGYFSFRIAHDYPTACCVMIDQGIDPLNINDLPDLQALCKEHSDLKNIIYLKKKMTVPELERLAECEHFDVVLALNVIHYFGHAWKEATQAILKLGISTIIEMPTIDSIHRVTPVGIRHLEDYSIAHGGVHLKTVTHATEPRTQSSLYCIEREKRHLGRNCWIRTLYHPERYVVVADYTSKFLKRKTRNILEPWVHGINLVTFRMLNGVYPEQKTLEHAVNALIEEYQTDKHKDFVPWNIIVQGEKLAAIDNDNLQGRRNLNFDDCAQFVRNFIHQRSAESALAYIHEQWPPFAEKQHLSPSRLLDTVIRSVQYLA